MRKFNRIAARIKIANDSFNAQKIADAIWNSSQYGKSKIQPMLEKELNNVSKSIINQLLNANSYDDLSYDMQELILCVDNSDSIVDLEIDGFYAFLPELYSDVDKQADIMYNVTDNGKSNSNVIDLFDETYLYPVQNIINERVFQLAKTIIKK